MPIYTYVCKDCGEQIEARQNFHDEPLTVCPVCGGALRKLFNAVGVVFKGSGFYRTDSREKKPAAAAASSKSDSSESSGSESTKSSSSSNGTGSTSGSSSKDSSSSARKPDGSKRSPAAKVE